MYDLFSLISKMCNKEKYPLHNDGSKITEVLTKTDRECSDRLTVR